MLEHEHHRVEELRVAQLVGLAASNVRLLELKFIDELPHQELLEGWAALKQVDQDIYVLGVCIVDVLREVSLHLFGEFGVLGAIGPILVSYHDERVHHFFGP